MPELLAALDAFLREHRRCGDLDAGVEGRTLKWLKVKQPKYREGERGWEP